MPARADLTLFTLRGIRIGLDYSWFFVLLLVVVWLSDFYSGLLGAGSGDLEPYLLAVASALLFFGSILLHELGHAVVAIRNGIAISDITLWMFGGVARMARDSDSPSTEFKVAIAGPVVTLAIAFACAGLGYAIAGDGFSEAMRLEQDADLSGGLAMIAWLGTINVLILGFNMIPAFPLDGGRVARAIAWWITRDRGKATRIAAGLGQGFSYLFMAFGAALLVQGEVIDGIWLAVLGFLLNQSARSAIVQTELSTRIGHLRVEDVMDADPVAIRSDLTIERAMDEYFLRYRWPWFPVVDPALRFLGVIRRAAADAIPEPARLNSRVADVVEEEETGELRIRVDAPLEDVLGNSALRRVGALAAVDAAGQLKGILTLDQVGRALQHATAGKAVTGS